MKVWSSKLITTLGGKTLTSIIARPFVDGKIILSCYYVCKKTK